MSAPPPARRVLVTGAAGGIGAAVVAAFLAEGAEVAALDSDAAALGRLAAARPAPALSLTADVARPAALAAAFATVDHTWPEGLDVLVNCAGISIRQPFLDTALDDWRRTLDINLTGTFLTAQHAARRMAGRAGAAVVNIASVSGMVGMPRYAAYNVSKAGVIELTKTMALELAPDIRVNSVSPGYVLTPMQRAEYSESALADCAAKLPLRRLGTPAEIAALVGYLASPAAAYITGQSFVADGGETAGGLASD